MEKHPTDEELGIDVTAMTNEALSMGATKYLPAAIKTLRQQKMAEYLLINSDNQDIIEVNI